MTVLKTDDDLKEDKKPEGPELVNCKADDPAVKAILKGWPKARIVQKLESGIFAIRHRVKRRTKTVKLQVHRRG